MGNSHRSSDVSAHYLYIYIEKMVSTKTKLFCHITFAQAILLIISAYR